jgi:hypothetical protein
MLNHDMFMILGANRRDKGTRFRFNLQVRHQMIRFSLEIPHNDIGVVLVTQAHLYMWVLQKDVASRITRRRYHMNLIAYFLSVKACLGSLGSSSLYGSPASSLIMSLIHLPLGFK